MHTRNSSAQFNTSLFPPRPGVMTRSDRFLFTLSDFGVVTSYIVSFKEEGISAKNKVILFMNKFVVVTIFLYPCFAVLFY